MTNPNEVLDGAITELVKIKAEVAQALKIIDAKIESLNSGKEELKQEKDSLAVREEAVQSVEDIIALENSAKQMLKEAKEKMSLLSKEKDDFDNYKNQTAKELSNLRNELNEKAKYIQKEYEALKKAQKQLEDDKASYKDKVAKSIVDLANEK